jgi:hypothetical protein
MQMSDSSAEVPCSVPISEQIARFGAWLIEHATHDNVSRDRDWVTCWTCCHSVGILPPRAKPRETSDPIPDLDDEHNPLPYGKD